MSNTCADDFEVKAGSSVQKCEVCGNASIYSCPRCELRTCSLNCVEIHKKELDCNGVRDKTAFKPLSTFSNLDLLSDYRFIEDITRTIDTCKKNPLKNCTRLNKALPFHLFKLKEAAKMRNTQLLLLPKHFTRHKENSTFYDYKTQVINWTIDFIFPQGDNIKIREGRVDENIKLSEIMSNYIDTKKCPKLYMPLLKFYHSAGMSDIQVLLKAEQVKEQSYYELEMDLSLKENLENKTIIEHPVVLVIRKGYKDEYNIIESDELKLGQNLNNVKSEFVPYHYFDTVNEVKKMKHKSYNSIKSIHRSTKTLKNMIGIKTSESTDSDSSLDQPIPMKKPLHIPFYQDLVKQ